MSRSRYARWSVDRLGRLHAGRAYATRSQLRRWVTWARSAGVYGAVERRGSRVTVSYPPIAWLDRARRRLAAAHGIEAADVDSVDTSALVGDRERAPLPASAYYTMTEEERAQYALDHEWRSPTPDDSLRDNVRDAYAAHPEWGAFDEKLWADLGRPSSWEVLQVRAPPGHPGKYADDSWSGDGPLRNLAREISSAAERDRWVVFYGGEVGDYGKILSISIS